MAISPASKIPLSDVTLTTPDKDTVILGDRIQVPTIVVLARYYG